MSNRKGILYVVATPIGNLGDMSARAVEVLSDVDLIAAEDTRHSLPLLRHFGITTPCIAYHEHNERQLSPELMQRILGGESIALISDAGTPLISDPGYHLVCQARQAECRVVPIPGPNALISALSVAGLPTHRFIFEGFLPAKSEARRRHLQALSEQGVYTGIWWYADHPTHYRGDSSPATAEKGEVYLAARARALARAIHAIKDDTETLRLQDEFFAASQQHNTSL